MKTLLCMLVALILVAGAAQAVAPPPDDGRGVLCVLTTAEPPFENYLQGVAAFQPIDLYFVLYHPLAPSGWIGAADFSWDFAPAPSFLVLASGGPGTSLNIGTAQEPILGFGVNAPVADGHALLFHVLLLFLADPGQTALFLAPNNLHPSVPGQMSYVDLENPSLLLPMLPYSQDDSFLNPVFGVNTMPVTAESVTWGGVKALFH